MLLKQPKTRPWTKSEYHQAAELGWFAGQRVELIAGEVLEMPPQKDEHSACLRLVDEAVRRAFPTGHTFLVQMPLNLGPKSEPEPDMAVVAGSPRTVLKHPKSALLVIEIADTSLALDRGRKARLYASRGIQDYWIVNLIDRQLEVHRRPAADGVEPFGHLYSKTSFFRPADSVCPLAKPRTKILVADLLP